LCPELALLSDDEVLYVILAYDYNSIYRQFPEEDRMRRARRQIFGEEDVKLSNAKMKKGISAYMSLQYDVRQEQIKVYEEKIGDLNLNLQNNSSTADIKKNLSSQTELRKAIKELQKELLEDLSQESSIQGGGKKTFIERMMENKEAYKSLMRKEKKPVVSVLTYDEKDDLIERVGSKKK
jgi:hypothetical protein